VKLKYKNAKSWLKLKDVKQENMIFNNVLVVDDSRSILGVVTAHLREIDGIEITTASSFAETRQLLDDNQGLPFLCAVLDLGLPDAPAGEVVDLVHARDIPIIVLTGSIDSAVRQTMTAKLIVDYVVKRNMNEIAYVATQVEKLYNNQFSKVLVVDDSKTYRSFIGSLLRNFLISSAISGFSFRKVLTLSLPCPILSPL